MRRRVSTILALPREWLSLLRVSGEVVRGFQAVEADSPWEVFKKK